MLYLICFLIGVGIGVCILLPKVKKVKLDTKKQLNEIREIQSQIIQITKNKLTLEKEYDKISFEVQNFKNEINLLVLKKKDLQSDINLLEEQASKNADTFYKDKMRIASMKFQQKESEMQSHFKEQSQKAEEEYLDVLSGLSAMIKESTSADKAEIEKLEQILKDLKIKVTCAVEANKREEEIRTQGEFYKLVIPKEDLEEIQKLREVGKYLRNKEPLNKIIWSIYYMKPTTDLIGRVVGSSVKTGIYKITNLTNQKCYVGQAADIASRWKQHIKRGLGAEPTTRNKLYPAMQEFGVENFSFEIIEECPRAELNEKEDYWQDYFHCIEFGYSIK